MAATDGRLMERTVRAVLGGLLGNGGQSRYD